MIGCHSIWKITWLIVGILPNQLGKLSNHWRNLHLNWYKCSFGNSQPSLCFMLSTVLIWALIMQSYVSHLLLLQLDLKWLPISGLWFSPGTLVYSITRPWSSLGGSVGCASDWRPGCHGFDSRRGRQHSFVEIDHEIFSTVILSLPLIQEGQLSVSGKRMCAILVNYLED